MSIPKEETHKYSVEGNVVGKGGNGKEFVFDVFRSVKSVLGQTPPTDLTLIISQGFGLSFLNHQLWKLYYVFFLGASESVPECTQSLHPQSVIIL